MGIAMIDWTPILVAFFCVLSAMIWVALRLRGWRFNRLSPAAARYSRFAATGAIGGLLSTLLMLVLTDELIVRGGGGLVVLLDRGGLFLRCLVLLSPFSGILAGVVCGFILAHLSRKRRSIDVSI